MRLAELWTRRGDLARAREHLERVGRRARPQPRGGRRRRLAARPAAVGARRPGGAPARCASASSRRSPGASAAGPSAATRAHGADEHRPHRARRRATSRPRAEALDGAFAAAVESRDMPIVAMTGVVAGALAARQGRPADAAEMLGAAAVVRGAQDEANLEIAAPQRRAARGAGRGRVQRGVRARPRARARRRPGAAGARAAQTRRPYARRRERHEDGQQAGHPGERPQQVRAHRRADRAAPRSAPIRWRERVDVDERLQPARHRRRSARTCCWRS